MQSTELVPSISISNLLNKRDAAIQLILEGLDKLSEASRVLNSEKLITVGELFNNDRYSNGVNIMDSKAAEKVKLRIDASGWQMLMNESGLKTFMTAKRKSDWDESIRQLKNPPLTRENIASTFESIHGDRLSMMEEGVINVFKNLSWEYKTNCPKMFDKKIIIKSLFDKFGYLNSSTCNELDDLLRVLYVTDGKPEVDHRRGMYREIGLVKDNKGTTYENDFFELKFFVKSGTAHLKFKRLDVVEKMNKILAKHFPNAIPSDFGHEKKEDFTPFNVEEDIQPVYLSNQAIQAIKNAKIVSTNDNGYGLQLTENLDRTTYQEVNTVLEEFGLKWVSSKKMHVIFASTGLEEALRTLCIRGKFYPSKNYGFYPTPSQLSERLVNLAEVEEGHVALEPSAGSCSIVDALIDAGATVHAVEYLPQNIRQIEMRKISFEKADFLKVNPNPIYDRVVMNPPFAKKQDMMHVMHAFRFLKGSSSEGAGGVLVAVMSASVKTNSDSFSKRFRAFVEMNHGEWHDVEHGAFKESGTMVNTVIVKIRKSAAFKSLS